MSPPEIREIDLSDQFVPSTVKPTIEAAENPSAYMSTAAVDEPQVETFEPQGDSDSPKIAVDPMMAEGGSVGASGTSFSEISELPPLKEVYVAPPPPPSGSPPVQSPTPVTTVFSGSRKADEKPKVQPREVAEKAIERDQGGSAKAYALCTGRGRRTDSGHRDWSHNLCSQSEQRRRPRRRTPCQRGADSGTAGTSSAREKRASPGPGASLSRSRSPKLQWLSP